MCKLCKHVPIWSCPNLTRLVQEDKSFLNRSSSFFRNHMFLNQNFLFAKKLCTLWKLKKIENIIWGRFAEGSYAKRFWKNKKKNKIWVLGNSKTWPFSRRELDFRILPFSPNHEIRNLFWEFVFELVAFHIAENKVSEDTWKWPDFKIDLLNILHFQSGAPKRPTIM